MMMNHFVFETQTANLCHLHTDCLWIRISFSTDNACRTTFIYLKQHLGCICIDCCCWWWWWLCRFVLLIVEAFSCTLCLKIVSLHSKMCRLQILHWLW